MTATKRPAPATPGGRHTTDPEPIRVSFRRFAGVRTRVLEVGAPVGEPDRTPRRSLRRRTPSAEHIRPTGPRLILLHGYCDSADTWRPVLAQLAAAGIPAVEFGPIGAGHHGPEEWVSLSSLARYRRALGDFVKGLPIHLEEREGVEPGLRAIEGGLA